MFTYHQENSGRSLQIPLQGCHAHLPFSICCGKGLGYTRQVDYCGLQLRYSESGGYSVGFDRNSREDSRKVHGCLVSESQRTARCTVCVSPTIDICYVSYIYGPSFNTGRSANILNPQTTRSTIKQNCNPRKVIAE